MTHRKKRGYRIAPQAGKEEWLLMTSQGETCACTGVKEEKRYGVMTVAAEVDVASFFFLLQKNSPLAKNRFNWPPQEGEKIVFLNGIYKTRSPCLSFCFSSFTCAPQLWKAGSRGGRRWLAPQTCASFLLA